VEYGGYITIQTTLVMYMNVKVIALFSGTARI